MNEDVNDDENDDVNEDDELINGDVSLNIKGIYLRYIALFTTARYF